MQPQILIEFPEPEEEKIILRYNLPFAPEQAIDYVVSFLTQAHRQGEPYTVRDGINVARFALKLVRQGQGDAPADSPVPDEALRAALAQAVRMILGEDTARRAQADDDDDDDLS